MDGLALWFEECWCNLPKGYECHFHDMLGHHMEIYINDIVIKSKKATKHANHLRKSFEMMRLHQMKLNPLKCAFGVQDKNFLVKPGKN